MAKNSMRGARGSTGPHKAEAAGSTPAPAISTIPPVSISDELLRDIQPLPVKQRRFVLEYLGTANGNATEAYRRAYEGAKDPDSLGPRLLRNARISGIVEKYQRQREAAAVLNLEKLDRALQDVIEFDPRRFYRPLLKDGQPVLDDEGRPKFELIPLPEWPDDLAKSLAGCEVEELFEGASGERFTIGQLKKWKRHDRTAALQLAYKRRGALVDKAEVEVKGITSVTVNIGVKKKGQG